MKIEIGKITLVMVAGIFAYSGALGLNENPLAQGRMHNFQEVKVVNHTSFPVHFFLKLSEKGETIEKKLILEGVYGETASINVSHLPIETVHFYVGGFDTGEIKLASNISRAEFINELRNELNKKFNESLAFRLKAEVDTLVISIDQK